MSDAGRVRRTGGAAARDEVDEVGSDAAPKELLDDVEELLDEIDEVLEENAEEFVRGYVQKGGQ